MKKYIQFTLIIPDGNFNIEFDPVEYTSETSNFLDTISNNFHQLSYLILKRTVEGKVLSYTFPKSVLANMVLISETLNGEVYKK